jgi:lycopene beta-cyclase
MPYEHILVGGGLQNALIALALLERRPAARFVLVERAPSLGGNHLWCFHAGDVPVEAMTFVAPLVERSWPGYQVAFPEFRRRLSLSYAAVTSARLDVVVRRRIAASPQAELLRGVEAAVVTAREVVLRDGRRLHGRAVIDARGPGAFARTRATGYQKFLGLELELARPHEERMPFLMDARVPQTDGFRFLYTLPLAADRLLIEDTYFSDRPDVDRPALRAGILAHASRLGLPVRAVAREESGVLPLPTRSWPAPPARGPLAAGYQGGWFHPVTGYSFPVALRLARYIAATDPDDLFGDGWRELVARHRSQTRFCVLLNRLLFAAFPPDQRWHALARFHHLPEDTIVRFYALRMTAADRARIVCGRPPRGLSLRAAFSGTSAA